MGENLRGIRTRDMPDYDVMNRRVNEYLGISPVTVAILNERAKAANVEAEPRDSFGVPISIRQHHDSIRSTSFKEIEGIFLGFKDWMDRQVSEAIARESEFDAMNPGISKPNHETDTVNDPAIVSIPHTEPEPEAKVGLE